jgi:hypothetical protein
LAQAPFCGIAVWRTNGLLGQTLGDKSFHTSRANRKQYRMLDLYQLQVLAHRLQTAIHFEAMHAFVLVLRFQYLATFEVVVLSGKNSALLINFAFADKHLVCVPRRPSGELPKVLICSSFSQQSAPFSPKGTTTSHYLSS